MIKQSGIDRGRVNGILTIHTHTTYTLFLVVFSLRTSIRTDFPHSLIFVHLLAKNYMILYCTTHICEYEE